MNEFVTQSPEQLLSQLFHFESDYDEDAIDYITMHPELFTPYLLEHINAVAENPLISIASDNSMGILYALPIIALYKEQKSHQSILQIANLQSDIIDGVLGDLLTQHLSGILYQTCGNNFEGICDLIRNREADPYARAAGVDAICFGVVDNVYSKELAIKLFASLLDPTMAAQGEYLFQAALFALYDLDTQNASEYLKICLEQNLLVDPEFDEFFNRQEMAQRDLEFRLSDPMFHGINAITEEKERACFDTAQSIHENLSWLYRLSNDEEDFSEEEEFTDDLLRDDQSEVNKQRQLKNKKTSTRKKNKAAKKSRKKNRR